MIQTKRIFFLLIGFFALSFSALATGNPGSNPAVEVRLISKIDDMQAFQLDVTSQVSDVYVVTITDASGNLLGKEWVKGKGITRKYAISSDVPEDEIIFIEVRAKRTGIVTVYKYSNRVANVQKPLLDKVS